MMEGLVGGVLYEEHFALFSSLFSHLLFLPFITSSLCTRSRQQGVRNSQPDFVNLINEAFEVLAKHDEEYMPAEVAEAVKGIKHEKPKYNLDSGS